MDASRDLAFLSELSQVPNGELAFYDYLCKSRYWTVEPRHESIYAILNNNGEKQLFSRISASTILVEFNHVPKERAGKADLQKNDLAHITQQNQFALKDFRTIILSDNSKLIVNSHERHGTARHFKKQVVAYFNDIAQDINENALELRLQAEDSVKTGFGSFGISDVMVSCSKSCVTQDNSICGWINLGERGFIYALLFDAMSGKGIGINKAFRSRQYVGSDEDANKRFFFELPLFLDGDGELVETRIVLCSSVDNRPFFTTNAVLQTWVK